MRSRARAGGPAPLSAEEIDGGGDAEDLGEVPFPGEAQQLPAAAPPATAIPDGAAAPAEDPPPAHGRREWRQPGRPAGRGRAPRVTAGVRVDITAKIAMPLEIGGRIWEARDPLCGGVFVAQRPDIADALADIVCESADLVAFFTGPGGAFMKYLNLAAALWPVLEAVGAHHVYHSVQAPDSPAEPPLAGRYAA